MAPNVKLPLMSARIVIKKALGGEILKGGKQARLDAVHHAVENHKAALEQLQLIAVHGPHGRFSFSPNECTRSGTVASG